jgi:hypothetical protein
MVAPVKAWGCCCPKTEWVKQNKEAVMRMFLNINH